MRKKLVSAGNDWSAVCLARTILLRRLQIPAEVYNRVMRQLMADVEFRCHVCCHNVSVAVIVFIVLLCLCLVLEGHSRSCFHEVLVFSVPDGS